MYSARQYTKRHVVSRDGTTIGYRTLGEGPPLILVHGGLQSAQNFMKLASALSDAFTLHVVDRRGRGLSGPHGEAYNLTRECEDLHAVVSATSARYVFGLSSGALVVLQAALSVPTILRMALYEPPLSVNHSVPMDWLPRFDREIATGKTASALATVLKGLDASPLIRALPRLMLVPFLRIALAIQARAVQDGDVSIVSLVPSMHFDQQLVIETEGSLEQFAGVTADVLLLGGSKSQAFLCVSLDALSRTLPHVRRVELEGLDHLGADNEGEPERVASELRRFFL